VDRDRRALTTAAAGDVRARVAAGRAGLVEMTRRLVEIPTENPPGRRYSDCVAALVELLEEAGLPAEVVDLATPDGTPHAAVRSLVGSGPTLWFHGHYDVVPAQHAGQFSAEIRDGRLAGRGSADMKGGLAAMILAASTVRDSGAALSGRVGLMFVPDEETGGAGGSAALHRAGLLGEDGIGMLSPEPTGGIAWNACRGAISLRVTVRGRSAHVGLSHAGVNAFTHMLDVAARLRVLATEVGERRTRYAIEPDAARGSILLLGGQVEAGASFNVVPESCSFTVDRRINPEEDLAEERDRLLQVLDDLRGEGHRIEVEVLQEEPAAGVAAETDVGRALAGAVREAEGRELRFELCPGLLEIRFYAGLGVPAYCYGPGRLDLAHGPDEQVEVDALEKCAEIYALAALDILAGPAPQLRA
jgi:acetylornithine deacetylase/succinyl-diaminopimelate desuccinylase family protein